MCTNSMPTARQIAIWIKQYFADNRCRTADVLTGPKRETWFSAETFVALNRAITPHDEFPEFPNFSCWGEQQYKAVFELLKSKCPTVGDVKRKPDVVCYNIEDGPEAVAAVIEIKLVLSDENANSCLAELKGQLLNAALLFPGADIVGLVFFATAPFLTPRTLELATDQLTERIKATFPDQEGFQSVPGFELRPVFQLVPTSFVFPKMNVSLSLTALHLPGQSGDSQQSQPRSNS
jgi:hypothetical protein